LAAGMIRGSVADASTQPQRRPALVIFTEPVPEAGILERRLTTAGADAVRTSITNVQTLRSLLALGLIVLVETPLPASTLEALAEFPIFDAASFSSAEAIAPLLLQPGKRASHD
jgi:hypothetical protein